MEYMTPNFTKDMVKTHKILIDVYKRQALAWVERCLACSAQSAWLETTKPPAPVVMILLPLKL